MPANPADPAPSASLTTRAGLARAITLVESNRADHQAAARRLLDAIMPSTGGAVRIGVTGVPGVGKSTFIDAFGSFLTRLGRRVAVLAVDPTSKRSSGSILGDKTRMARLAVDPAAFIRPSPAGAALGGVARRTRETMLLCEAAGFDTVIVETVGVGQSETLVADMVDFFLLLMLPNAGDELQGIKKGVIELADMVAVNKADLDARAAERAARQYEQALHILDRSDDDWRPTVTTLSASSGDGLDRIWAIISRHRAVLGASGALEARRTDQQVRWFDSLIDEGLRRVVLARPRVAARLDHLRAEVGAGRIAASTAAEDVLDLLAKPD